MTETPNNPKQPEGAEPPTSAPSTPGYWESQAAGTPTPPPYPGTPYPPQPGYPQQGYPQQGYPQQAYPQPGYGQPAYGYPAYAKPAHPQANTALIVGIIGLAGGLTFCGVPLLASPFAWVIGQRAKADIDREPERWSGRDHANTGMILGIIGTVLLALALIGILIFVLIVASDPSAFE